MGVGVHAGTQGGRPGHRAPSRCPLHKGTRFPGQVLSTLHGKGPSLGALFPFRRDSCGVRAQSCRPREGDGSFEAYQLPPTGEWRRQGPPQMTLHCQSHRLHCLPLHLYHLEHGAGHW